MKTPDVRERFLYWIKERESIRNKKEAGEAAPWTEDPILQSYRFCNVRRMDDRVSRWLNDHWYSTLENSLPELEFLEVCTLARYVNKIETFEKLNPLWPKDCINTLVELRKAGTIYGAAYIIPNAGYSDKLDLLHDILYAIPKRLPRVFQQAHKKLLQIRGVGSFMAGQILADYFHYRICRDKLTWAPIGPGSRRGMNRFHSRSVNYSLSQNQFTPELKNLISWTRAQLPEIHKDRGLKAMDYQNCLCEFDKYERCLAGGRGKRTYAGKG